MTSRPRREHKPITGVELKVEFAGERPDFLRSYPELERTRRGWSITIRGTDPSEVATRAREIFERVKKSG